MRRRTPSTTAPRCVRVAGLSEVSTMRLPTFLVRLLFPFRKSKQYANPAAVGERT